MTFEHAFLTLMALGFFGFLLLCGVSERVLERALGGDEDAWFKGLSIQHCPQVTFSSAERASNRGDGGQRSTLHPHGKTRSQTIESCAMGPIWRRCQRRLFIVLRIGELSPLVGST